MCHLHIWGYWYFSWQSWFQLVLLPAQTDFIFLGSKITTDGGYSHEIKRCLLLGRKVMTNLDSILKSRDITLPTKVHLVKAMVFPVVMYGCDSWTVKKAELRRIDAFELWCWRRLLRVPWTARRSNQSIMKEISPGISLEGMMLKLKLQYFGHLMQKGDSLKKTLMLGGIRDRRRRGRQRMRWLDGITDSMDVEFEWTPGVHDGQEGLACCNSWGRKELDTTDRLNWTDTVKGFGIINKAEVDVFLKQNMMFFWSKSKQNRYICLISKLMFLYHNAAKMIQSLTLHIPGISVSNLGMKRRCIFFLFL